MFVDNSSVGIRECGMLGVPVVNIGSRQNQDTVTMFLTVTILRKKYTLP